MKFFILSGSHRKSSQSEKVAFYFEDALKKSFNDAETDVFLLAGNPLPLWDEGVWEQTADWKSAWGPIKTRLEACDAIIVVAPEWGGMAPPGLKNFLLLASGAALAHKPGLIVSVSGSRNGAYPVFELRGNSSKNNQICYIPEHIIVRNAEKVLNSTPSTDPLYVEEEKYLRTRIDYSLKLLNSYAVALKGVRASGVVDSKTFPFGM